MNIKTLLGVIVFLGFPFLLQLLAPALILGELAFWILLLLIVSWIYFVEKRTLGSIGLKKLAPKTIFLGIGLGLVLFVVFGLITTLIQTLGLPLNQDAAQLIASQPIPILLLIALRAGVVEEVLYRAYAFERLFDLTNSRWIAALVPVIIFALAHLPWGFGHIIFVFFAGGSFMLVYLARRDLGLIMIAHFTTDVLALLLLPMLLEA